MRRLLLPLGIVLVVAGFAVSEASACGDKFLVIGRGAKRVQKARHPASVLLYQHPGSSLETATKDMKLEARLREAGHSVDSAATSVPLKEAVGSKRYDFVLVDLADAQAAAQQLEGLAGRPAVVPVTDKATDAALASAKAEYGLVIKTGKSLSYLPALDDAMSRRPTQVATR